MSAGKFYEKLGSIMVSVLSLLCRYFLSFIAVLLLLFFHFFVSFYFNRFKNEKCTSRVVEIVRLHSNSVNVRQPLALVSARKG